MSFTPPVFCSYAPTYYSYYYGYYPMFGDPYYSSPLEPLGDWISANKYYHSSFHFPTFWGFGYVSRDVAFASFGDTLWYRSAGFTFFDSPWGTGWELSVAPFVGQNAMVQNDGLINPSTKLGASQATTEGKDSNGEV